MGVLVDVDKDAASGAFGDGAFIGNEVGMFGGNHASDDFGEGAELLVGVDRLDGKIKVHAGGAGSLEKDGELELREFFVEGFRDGDNDGEVGAVGRVEVEEEIVGMIDVGVATAPGIVVDAAEASEIEERGTIVGDGVMDDFAAMFGIYGNSLKPVGEAMNFAEIFLEESQALDAVGITAEDERAIFEERKDVIGHAVVVGEKISLGAGGFGEIDFVEIGDAETLAVEIHGGIVGAALEEFGFDLGFGGEDFANDRRGVDKIGRSGFGWSRRGRFELPGAVSGVGIVAKREKDGVAETMLVGPGRIAHAGNQFRANPGGFFVGAGRFGKGRTVRVE